MKFLKFKELIQKQLDFMITQDNLFITDIDKEDVWNTYLDSFPEGSNHIYKERTEHDCNCCKNFIRDCGNVVAIINNELVSIWDINIGGEYQVVADALSEKVKTKPIKNKYLHYQNKLGTNYNHQQLEDGSIKKWNHFYYELPGLFVNNQNLDTELSKVRSARDVFKRGLEEITIESIEIVLDLISQNSLYKGEEFKSIIEKFYIHKNNWNDSDNYTWLNYNCFSAKIRNSSIGTLLLDLSEGKELDYAVTSFEKKVAPINYKRPTSLITKGMIKKAKEKINELGVLDSLPRRHSVIDDITINNVLFANREAKKEMDVFDELEKETKVDLKNFDKIEEVSIDNFIKDILPKASSIELLFDNKNENNLMTLTSPVNIDAKSIFKWDNNFSWSYNGDVTDSIKENVKKAGGRTNGVLRFSIQWNEKKDNQNDLDAHCIEPNRNKIYYSNKGLVHKSSGMLDVDIVRPGYNVAIENIIYTDKNKMPIGEYKMLVNNYSERGGIGFKAQIEYNGKIFNYSYSKKMRQNEKVEVATVNFNGNNFTITNNLDSKSEDKEVWGINTNKFHNVKVIMNSPNHWDGNSIGNKHYFFILEDCKNPLKVRGFYNEYLKQEFNENRKVFEMLGDKMKTEPKDEQLSGLGFSSTKRDSIICKVSGSFNRTIKINF